jgi:hypothetical protein
VLGSGGGSGIGAGTRTGAGAAGRVLGFVAGFTGVSTGAVGMCISKSGRHDPIKSLENPQAATPPLSHALEVAV